MIYRTQFIKDSTLTAIGISVLLLAVLMFTQAVKLLGRAADGSIAIDAVATLIGFWTLGMTPLLLALTAYISILSTLTRYWRDSEMAIWLASGLSLRSWVRPVLNFALPLAVLVAIVQLAVLPWAENRAYEYAEVLKQKQNLSLVEAGTFRELGKSKERVYFVETFDSDEGKLSNLFIREAGENGKDNVIFAKNGRFTLEDNKRMLVLEGGYRYSGAAGKGDFEQVSFQKLNLLISGIAQSQNPFRHRSTIPTSQLLDSDNPQHQGELMWRISLPIAVVILSLLAIPISYNNNRSPTSFHILTAISCFLFYQHGLTLLHNMIYHGKLNFWLGLLPMHLMMLLLAQYLLNIRTKPALPLRQALRQSTKGKQS